MKIKTIKVLYILSWISMGIFIVSPFGFVSWFVLVMIGSIAQGVKFIRRDKIAHGICLILFNRLSLGIWGYIVIKQIDNKKSLK